MAKQRHGKRANRMDEAGRASKNESNRATAVLAGSHVDHAFTELLSARVRELFVSDRALLYAKCLARCLAA